MKKNKIKKITLKGFRGVKNELEIDLENTCSLLVYGDNGTGKSTITDSLEWFIYDRISHLKGEEIPKNEGIRNTELNEKDICHADIDFSNPLLHSKKTLEIKNDKLISKHSNKNEVFLNYLKESSMENLIIRSDELIKFIISTKSKRLTDISDLIGYSEVKKTKEIFKKVVSGLKRSIATKSFEDQIASKQSDLLGLLNENINDEHQFFLKIDTMSKKIQTGFKVDSWENLKKLELELSKVKLDPKLQLKSEIIKEISNIKAKESILNQLFESLDSFQVSFKKLFEDKEKLKGIKLKSLLKSAEHIIKSKAVNKENECPLCLQEISSEELLNSIQHRLNTLQLLEKETETLNQTKNNTVESIREIGELIGRIKKLECIKDTGLESTKKQLDDYLDNFRASYKIFSTDLNFNSKTYYDECISKIRSTSLEQIKNQLEKIKESIKETPDSKIDLAKKISLAKSFFKDIQSLKKKRQLYELQIQTMDKIYKSFANYQKKEMELFLSSISSDMNYFFNYMNPSDNIKDIELIPLSNDEGDFIGISYKLDFRSIVSQSPKMLLSESYLNCLGLCLFLSSVKSFNKKNGFFILDDVISSFDKNHRLLFGRLLIEKFSDWQLIVLTHEDEWFKYLSSLVKPEKWLIRQMKWNEHIGSFIDNNLPSLKEKIERQIGESNVDGLGNQIGRYLESILKKICQSLEANLTARFGDDNEKRNLEELLNSLIVRIKKKKMGLENHEAIRNLKNAQFFRNQTSHDNPFNANLTDMKVCFQDIIKFESLFICSKTGEPLLSSHASDNKIQTKSGYLSYNWK